MIEVLQAMAFIGIAILASIGACLLLVWLDKRKHKIGPCGTIRFVGQEHDTCAECGKKL